MPLQSTPGYTGFRGGHLGHAYNEAAFRHFLAVDRRRALRTARTVLLILASVRRPDGATVKLANAEAGELFSGLGAAVREVDFVGWYREGYVAGAVLAQSARPAAGVLPLIAERIQATLRSRVSFGLAPNLRIRVVQLGGRIDN